MAQTVKPSARDNLKISVVGTKVTLEFETDPTKVTLVKSKGEKGNMLLVSASLYQALADLGYTGNLNIWKR